MAEKDDVIYGRKADLALTMDVFTPAKQNGAAIVHLANGGWHKAHGEPQNFAELLKRGYTVFRVVIASEPKFTVLEQAARRRPGSPFHSLSCRRLPHRSGSHRHRRGLVRRAHVAAARHGRRRRQSAGPRSGRPRVEPRAGRGRLLSADRFVELRSTGRRARGRFGAAWPIIGRRSILPSTIRPFGRMSK